MKIKNRELNKGRRVGLNPAEVTAVDYRKLNPKFSVQYTVPGFCIADCDQEQKAAFAATILQLGKRTWLEIMQSDRHGSGSEKIPRKQMKVAVPGHISTDQEFFTVVRFWGKSPLIGYVHQGVYYIVWLDRDHVCY